MSGIHADHQADPADRGNDPARDGVTPNDAPMDRDLLGALFAGLGLESEGPGPSWFEDLPDAGSEEVDYESTEDEPAPTVRSAGASNDAVKDYLRSIGKTKLLTGEEERQLARCIEAGVLAADRLISDKKLSRRDRRDLQWIAAEGQRARDHFIQANLRLVISIARAYAGHGTPFLDLVQEGNLGLIRAVEKFDYTKGFKFSTYATWWIRQSISRAMADQARMIRLPVHMVERINTIRRFQRHQATRGLSPPSVEEIALHLQLTVKEVESGLAANRSEPISFEEPFPCSDVDMAVYWPSFNDRTVPLYLLITEDEEFAMTPDEAVSFVLLQEQLESVLDTLSDREAGVVRMRFGLADGQPKTLDEIGKVYGLTRERIRQIEGKAMTRLRHPSRSEVLRNYLPGDSADPPNEASDAALAFVGDPSDPDST